MIKLNYSNLDEQIQNYLHSLSIKDVDRRYGEQLWTYAIEHGLDYDELLETETLKNLYSYRYIFSI